MFAEGYSFPHPVLGNDDDISGEFNISLNVARNDSKKIVFENVTVTVTNSYIQNHIDCGNAKAYVKVYCASSLTTWMFEANNMFEIDEDEIVNRVELQVFILTTKDVQNYSDSSFNAQYGNELFSLSKNEVIGISGSVAIAIPKANEKLGLGNIFKFNFHDTGKPIHFEYHHDKIFINYPVTKMDEHPPNLLFSTSPWTAFNIFIVPALENALKYIKDDPDAAEQWNWYSVLDSLLPIEKRTGDYFADAQKIIQNQIPVLLACEELLKK